MTTLDAFDDGIREVEPSYVDIDSIDLRLGADSLVWKFYGDIRGLLGFQRLAGTENCIEQLAQGVEDHSVIFADFLGRARRTGPPIMRTVYSDEPQQWGRRVRDFHRDIKGTISDGSRYHALNPELYYWAHATFVDQVLFITDTFIRRLSDEEKAAIFEESKTWYQLYGVSARSQPQTYEEFRLYWDRMCDKFVPTRTIMYATGYLRKGVPGPAWLPSPVWRIVSAPLNAFLQTIIVGTLPDQMKRVCELDWSPRRQRRFDRFAATMRALNPLFNRLPLRILYVKWAVEGWERTGVDPRRIHNTPADRAPVGNTSDGSRTR
ncbi:oxygenase MpaB family protein [Gordonia aichiensis]|uniref:oxygenase MpaB family protein n=1 Tax=Gordonia aichiensis TaxID=36820 RepID=UPI0032678DD9